jgi:hypothetical protein
MSASRSITKIGDYPLAGMLPEGAAFDPSGRWFLATAEVVDGSALIKATRPPRLTSATARTWVRSRRSRRSPHGNAGSAAAGDAHLGRGSKTFASST